MYDMKYFNANAKKLRPRCLGIFASYELDNHLIDIWDACSPYVSIRVDGVKIASRALKRNAVKIALNHLNNERRN